MAITPSVVLQYGLIPAGVFGVREEDLDTTTNLVSLTLADAVRVMEAAGVVDDASSRYESALAKVTLSRLIRHYAANKTRFTGYQIARAGRTETPLGSFDEMMKAADEYMRQAEELYPDADWPAGARSAGVVRFRRVF